MFIFNLFFIFIFIFIFISNCNDNLIYLAATGTRANNYFIIIGLVFV